MSGEDPKKPRPEEEPLPDLPELDDNTDILELEVDLTAPEPEPESVLPDLPDPLDSVEHWPELDPHEPEATPIRDGALERAVHHLTEDDLEDFATQEELPILPWSSEVEVLEAGATVDGILDPTSERSTWTSDSVPPGAQRLTIRIGAFDLQGEVVVSPGPTGAVRLGRNLLAGRVLIAVP